MLDLRHLLETIEHGWLYFGALVFFAWYPIVSSFVWIFTSVLYFFRRERRPPESFYELEEFPLVTVLIPAYAEEDHIGRSIEGILRIDYPNFEVVVINDGSPDSTLAKLFPYVESGRVRVIHKKVNEGKAMALNDALPCTNGEIILIMDADAVPDPGVLRAIVPHFRFPRVGAVTGNPRVVNRSSFISKLQTIEFTSIISLQRRAQRIWGRILTMSGVVGAFHRDVLLDAGLYSPEMATEDIDMTWKIQLRRHDVRYEPRALVWMQVPPTLRGLVRQRRRWALGLAQVLRRHGRTALRWRNRRIWPILAESVLSILWAYCFVILTGIWILSYGAGYPPVGASPIPNWWGMLIGTVCLAQLLTGVVLDRRYDKNLGWYYGVAVFYPLVYWILMACVTAVSSPKGLLLPPGRGAVTRWRTVREAA
jgi:biofilm PGA synthesis N-glycosyltransferase PgaC